MNPEVEALALYYEGLIEDAKQVRETLKHVEGSSLKDLEQFDRLILALGIFDKVVQVKQPLDYELPLGWDANGSPV